MDPNTSVLLRRGQSFVTGSLKITSEIAAKVKVGL